MKVEAIKLQFIMNIAIREVEKNLKWDGEITGIKEISSPVTFKFAIPFASVDDFARLCTMQWAQIARPEEAETTRNWFLETCDFSIGFANGKPVTESQQEGARENFREPVAQAIALLFMKGRDAGTFRIPVVTTEEEAAQFHNRHEFEEYVLSLNS